MNTKQLFSRTGILIIILGIIISLVFVIFGFVSVASLLNLEPEARAAAIIVAITYFIYAFGAIVLTFFLAAICGFFFMQITNLERQNEKLDEITKKLK